MTRLSPVFALLLAACVPNNAVLEGGEYLAFFPLDGSPVIGQGVINVAEEGTVTTINCSPDIAEANNSANCEALRAAEGVQFPNEPWTDDDSYEVLFSPLVPWRGEGIITNEGDLQVIFHHPLTGGEDFRFLFVINPDFQPLRCVQGANGPEWEDVDGDWVGNWSAGLENGRRFYLNAGASQFDPNPTTWKPFEFDWNEWFLPNEWRAGYAVGRYGPSFLSTRRTQYEFPWLRAEMAQDWAGVTTGDEQSLIEDPAAVMFYEQDCADIEALADGMAADLTAVTQGLAGGTGNINLRPRVECNTWREPDGIRAGLDAWRELNYSWVEIDNGSTLEVGGSVTGHFRIGFEGSDSQTSFILEGDFTVDKLQRERWGNPDLNTELLLENGVELCGGSVSEAGARMNDAVGFDLLEKWSPRR